MTPVLIRTIPMTAAKTYPSIGFWEPEDCREGVSVDMGLVAGFVGWVLARSSLGISVLLKSIIMGGVVAVKFSQPS